MNRLETLINMLKEQPADSFLLFALALEYVKLNDDTKASHYFNEILKHEPTYEGLYYHLGKLYERRSDFEKAKEIYSLGLEITRGKNQKAYNEIQSALDEISE